MGDEKMEIDVGMAWSRHMTAKQQKPLLRDRRKRKTDTINSLGNWWHSFKSQGSFWMSGLSLVLAFSIHRRDHEFYGSVQQFFQHSSNLRCRIHTPCLLCVLWLHGLRFDSKGHVSPWDSCSRHWFKSFSLCSSNRHLAYTLYPSWILWSFWSFHQDS